MSAVPAHYHGDNNVWETANQMFGISSRVATIVEYIYLLNNKDMFTDFEYGFFFAALHSDVMIEISILLHVLLVILEGISISTWKALKFLLMDPVNILAGVNLNADGFSRGERHLIFCTLFIFEVSMISSLVIWASYPQVWNSGFTKDRLVRWALLKLNLIHNLGLFYGVYRECLLRLNCFPVFSSGQFKLKYSLVSSTYILEKTLKLYILLSNKERLVIGITGEFLVASQVEKVFAAAIFLFRLWIPE